MPFDFDLLTNSLKSLINFVASARIGADMDGGVGIAVPMMIKRNPIKFLRIGNDVTVSRAVCWFLNPNFRAAPMLRFPAAIRCITLGTISTLSRYDIRRGERLTPSSINGC